MYKYPKLLLLLGSFLFSYVLYHQGFFDFLDAINDYGYVSMFLAGLFFSFGFTTPFAIAAFVEMAPFVHPLPAAIVGGIGAFFMDLFILEIIRFSTFHDELHHLRRTRLLRWMTRLLHHESVSERMRRCLLWSVAGLIIASPLPDEIGVSLIGGVTDVETRRFALLCMLLNTIGILLILLAARSAA